MADSHRSPLEHLAGRFALLGAGSGGAVRIEEVPFLTQLDLRLDPKSEAAGRAGLALGVSLPLEPNTTARAGDLVVLWLGPDEWLVLAPPGAQVELEAALTESGAVVVDVSAQRTTLALTGPRARDVLAHGCALDLHPRVFAGGCAQTTLARAQVVLVAEPDGFRVLVRSSFAAYLGEWLLDAASEIAIRPA
jgi:sarcosine oxidase subunit gamma